MSDSVVAVPDDEYRSNADVSAMISGLNNPSGDFVSSMNSGSFQDRVRVVSALSSSKPLIDNLNVPISLVHYIVQTVQIQDERSGVVNTAPRVTLIDSEGNAYNATSIGVLQALRTFVAVLGEPSTWEEPLVVVASEERSTRNSSYRFLTLKAADLV